jgi:hypothetical protein
VGELGSAIGWWRQCDLWTGSSSPVALCVGGVLSAWLPMIGSRLGVEEVHAAKIGMRQMWKYGNDGNARRRDY